MAWFRRDHTGRALSEAERVFIDGLISLLMEVGAPQVDENETALTGEGAHCLIVLIPHRALGGISIVVWLFSDRAEVTWAQVAGLDCCHDSLDLGITVGQFALDKRRHDFGPLLASVRAQLRAPLTLRWFGSDRAAVLVRDDTGVLREVGEIGRHPGWSGVLPRGVPTDETVVSLIDAIPPALSEPSGVANWFGNRGGGA